MSYRKAKVVQAVDDVDHWTLATFDKVHGLEERWGGDAVLQGPVVEVLQVTHGLERYLGVRLEFDGRHASRAAELVQQSAGERAQGLQASFVS